MTKFLLPLFLLFNLCIYAQQSFNIKNSEVSEYDLNATSYEKDAAANAFYIYEKGETEFQDVNDHGIVTRYEAKIKILNNEGYDTANIKIRLSKSESDRQKIKDIVATTYYLEDGIRKEKKLLDSQIYTEENTYQDMVSFTFPALKPGAVLVYSYTKESPFIFNFQTWWFQTEIPKVYSEFNSKIPGNYKYNIQKIGELKLASQESDIQKRCFFTSKLAVPADCMVTTYVMNNIPAFIAESHLTSSHNYVSRIEYELQSITQLDGYVRKYTKSWEDVDKEIKFDNGLGKQLKRTSLVEDLLPENIRSMPEGLEKAQEIFNFVKNTYSWNGSYKIFYDMNLKDIIKDKSGTIASINILLHNIYENEGFTVKPVLSSTRNNGTPTKLYPILSDFNYLMVQLELENTPYLLDASEKNIEFGMIPFRALNSYARLIDFDSESSWIDINAKTYSNVTYKDSLAIYKDGTASGHSKQSFSGYHALQVRNDLQEISQEQVFNKISTPMSFTTSSNFEIYNQKEIEEPLSIDYTLKNQSQKVNGMIYFNPFSFKLFDKNPFTLKERNYPIDFGFKDGYYYYAKIKLPEDHTLVALPESKAYSLPENGGSIQFSTRKVSEKEVMVVLRVTFPKAVYPSAYYPYLKEFFNHILEIQDQSLIVLKENS
ncbi:DUF3857 domain-containing protein [Gillisia sp. Hel_I_29]|uniref:DUF3857 domain-containing protein n=1 Tax=Gillisia sp. Hel_I_29 TaxID=1249975 RepID=UPI00055976C0|nr:DUF3857 domain-containing protein [Gillisia sp. Hel_I_29]